MDVDWSDGDYERMAADLQQAAIALVEYAGVAAHQHVLDVGCGTGNATDAAARLGARVTGVDPAEGLIELARDRVAVIDADVTFGVGSAEALPVSDAIADVTLSAFGVIFANDPAAAVAEMARATRPGGTVALTSWRTEGAIFSTGDVIRRRLPPAPALNRWGDDEWIQALLTDAGLVDIEIAEGTVEFRADSPEEFLDELESHHPAWRAALGQLSDQDRADVHEESLGILDAGNEDPDAFLATSSYALVRATVSEGEG